MIVLGLILLLVGIFAAIHILYVVGGILLIVGLVLMFAPGPWVGTGPRRRRYY